MKSNLFKISLIVAALTLLVNLFSYPLLPNKIPVHWGVSGNVDRYGSRIEQLLMGALPIVLLFVLQILPKIDPKKKSFHQHSKAYSMINMLMIVFLAGMNLMALSSALGVPIPFPIVVPLFLGLLMIGIGNYTTQLRHNYFIGFRTPWTLASENVWRKTHRLGGYLFVLVGLIPISSIIIGGLAMKFFIAALLIVIVLIYAYSFWLFKKIG